MNKAPAFKMYPSDFFGNPKVRLMSGEAQAFYALLLLNLWDYDTQYSIPDDDELIAKLLKVSLDFWKKLRLEIISALETRKGRLISLRLKEEKSKIDKYMKLQKEKAKKGGRPRKPEGNPRDILPKPVGLSKGGEMENPEETQPEPEPEPEPYKEKDNIPKTLFLNFVYLTEDENQKLVDKLGEQIAGEMIDRLNGYIGQIGELAAKKKYKSHYHTILNWWNKDQKECANQAKTKIPEWQQA